MSVVSRNSLNFRKECCCFVVYPILNFIQNQTILVIVVCVCVCVYINKSENRTSSKVIFSQPVKLKVGVFYANVLRFNFLHNLFFVVRFLCPPRTKTMERTTVFSALFCVHRYSLWCFKFNLFFVLLYEYKNKTLVIFFFCPNIFRSILPFFVFLSFFGIYAKKFDCLLAYVCSIFNIQYSCWTFFHSTYFKVHRSYAQNINLYNIRAEVAISLAKTCSALARRRATKTRIKIKESQTKVPLKWHYYGNA